MTESKVLQSSNNGWEGYLSREIVKLIEFNNLYFVQHSIGLKTKTFTYRKLQNAQKKFNFIDDIMVKKEAF